MEQIHTLNSIFIRSYNISVFLRNHEFNAARQRDSGLLMHSRNEGTTSIEKYPSRNPGYFSLVMTPDPVTSRLYYEMVGLSQERGWSVNQLMHSIYHASQHFHSFDDYRRKEEQVLLKGNISAVEIAGARPLVKLL